MRKTARSVMVPATTTHEPPVAPEAPREFRFRCGHAEPEAAATRRMRRNARAVWISCQSCNVIAVAIMTPPGGESEQTG